jgi:hypothetical protein
MKKLREFIITPILLMTGLLFGLFPVVKCQEVVKPDFVNLSSAGELKIDEPMVNSKSIGLYEKFEISFNLEGEWDNPFDPDQIKVDAHFYAPDGKLIIIPGFFYQEYHQNINNSVEKTGNPIWKIRFTPEMTGIYKYELVANNKGKEIKSPSYDFTGISYNINHGFIKISETNPLYFEFDDGSPFFAVSMDNAVNRYFNYPGIYDRFARAGGNYNRLFLQSGDLDLGETLNRTSAPDRGFGKINLDASWKLDKVIELGESLGIYHQLCLTNQYNFNVAWKSNVFNKENGGILDSPEEYFTSEPAMKNLENRFRYIVARWGYSTSVFSWNLWNEYSAQPGFTIPAAVAWHQRMARYISSIDRFRHVIHTNDGRLNGVNEISSMPEMGIISTNTYGLKNIAEVAEIWTKKFISQFKKPYVLAEFGIGHSNLPPGGYGGVDPERRMIHDALWSPLMSGSAGTGMAWEYKWLDDQIFYTFIKAVSKIVRDIPFNKRQWMPVKISSFRFKNPQPSHFADAIIEGWNPTGNYGMPKEAANHKTFHIERNGKVEANEYLNATLADTTGTKNTHDTPSVTFTMEYPEKGEFIVFVSDVRNVKPSVKLRVTIDGKESLNKELLPVPFLQYFPLSVTKGSHTILIENAGGGEFQTSFELKNFILKNGPDLEVRGLQSVDYILLWIKNQKYTLLHEMSGIGFTSQPEGILELQNVPEGFWLAEWVNTIDGVTVRKELVKSENQKLVLKTPVIKESVAIRLQKIK